MSGRTPYEVRIQVEGQLDPGWSLVFPALDLSVEGEAAVLSGPVSDQAALHGLLDAIRDLGMCLVSVQARTAVPQSGPASDTAVRRQAEEKS